MRVHRLRIKDFRGVDEHEVSFTEQGVTVVEGPNEVGKTSLAEALDLLFEAIPNSTAQDVRRVKPVDRDVGPEVEAEISTGPYRFTYRKRFLKDNLAELTVTEPRPENLSGREAHDRAEQILEETVDVALWKALRVRQGTAVKQAELADKHALSKALDDAAGASPIGDRELSLFEAAASEYDRYWTATGREKAPLKDVDAAVEGARAQVNGLEDRYRRLEADVERSDQVAGQLRDLRAQLPELAAKRDEWREKRAELERVQHVVGKADAEHKEAVQRLARVTEAKEARARLVERVAKEEARVEEARQAFDDAAPDLEPLELAAKEAPKTVEGVRREHASATREAQLRREDLDHLVERETLDRLERAWGRVDEARAAIKAQRAELAKVRITDEAVEAVREATLVVRGAEERLAEGGPRVEVVAHQPLDLVVDESERALAKGDAFEETIEDTLRLSAPGTLELVVSAGQSTEALRARRNEARATLERLLDEAGATDLDDALAQNERRRGIEAELARAQDRLASELDGRETDELEAELAAVRDRSRSYREQRVEEPPLPADAEAAREALKAADARVADAAGKLDVKERERDEAREALAAAKERLSRLDLEGQAAERALEQARHDLEVAREEAPDDAVEKAVEACQTELETRAAALAKAREREAALEPETVNARAENAERTHEKADAEVRELEKEQAALERSLRDREQEGLHEALDAARSALQHADGEATSVRRRADAAKLLYDVLTDEREKAKRAYAAPLAQRITALGSVLHGPDFGVELGEDLTVESRTLNGRTVPFEDLSTGAQEQLGLLARLACAQIVAADGGVPVILDDTLGYTDPSRLEAMGAVLSTAGRDCQIIVLTCMPDRYRHVGTAEVHRLR